MPNQAKIIPLTIEIGEMLSAKLVDEDTPPSYSDGDDGGSGMEARIVRLETIIEQTDKRLANIESDARETRKELRVMFYFQIASLATILGVVAKGFGWLK